MTISEQITTLAKKYSEQIARRLEAAIGESVFGLWMDGLPSARPGQRCNIDGSGSVTMKFVRGPEGRRMIKACADPEIFETNHPGSYNVTMTGREIIVMAQKMPEAEGVLICSATSFHSYLIYRDRFRALLETGS